MARRPSVSIIILNYNGLEHLDACLESVEAMTYPRDSLEIVLADNGSTDRSLEHVRERFPGVTIHDHGENLGFAAGNNRSAEQVDSEFVAFLNNDVRVEPDWLEPLVDALEADSKVVCTGSRVLDFPGERVLFAGSAMHFSGFGYQTGMGDALDDHPADLDPSETLFATGCAMLARRDVFVRTGGFVEDFFAYYEDVDLGWRWWTMGLRTLYVPRSIIYHKGSASFRHAPSDRKQRMWNRNVLAAMTKNYEQSNLARLLPVAVLLTIERALFFLDVEGAERRSRVLAYFPGMDEETADEQRRQVGLAHLSALGEFVEWLPVMIEKRQAIQRERGLSDEELFRRFPLEIDYRDQVNEARERSFLHRLMPLVELSGLFDADRIDGSFLKQMGKLEGMVERYRERTEILEGELARRAETIEHWVSETKKLNDEVTRLAPLEAELAAIKQKKWYRAIMALRRLRGGGEGPAA